MTTTFNPQSSHDLAYVAGLFDGEGCVYIAAPPASASESKFQLLVHISNNYLPIIQDLQEVYGGLIQEITTARKNINFTVHWRSQKAATFLKVILPYLHIKREQAELALVFQEHMALGRKTRTKTEADIAYRRTCHDELKRLKHAYFIPNN